MAKYIDIPSYVNLRINLLHSSGPIERNFYSSGFIKDISYEFLAETNAEFGVQLDLLSMPVGDSILVGTIGRSICDAVLLLSLNKESGPNTLNISSIHHRPFDRNFTLDTIVHEKIHHGDMARRAFHIGTTDILSSVDIVTSLKDFTQGGTVTSVLSEESGDLGVIITKKDKQVDLDFYQTLEDISGGPFSHKEILLN